MGFFDFLKPVGSILSSINPILGAGASVLGSVLGNKSAQSGADRRADEANALNYRMFKEQNDFNLDMWNRNNDYNSPVNQLSRLQEAGFNPYLSGLDGSVSSGTMQSAAASPAQMAQTFNPVSPLDALGAVTQASLLGAQKSNIEADTESKKQDTAYKKALESTENSMRDGRIDFLGVQIKLADAQTEDYKKSVDQRSQQIAQSIADVEMSREQMLINWSDLSLRQQQMQLNKLQFQWLRYVQKQQLNIQQRQLANDLFRSYLEKLRVGIEQQNVYWQGRNVLVNESNSRVAFSDAVTRRKKASSDIDYQDVQTQISSAEIPFAETNAAINSFTKFAEAATTITTPKVRAGGRSRGTRSRARRSSTTTVNPATP